MSSTSASTLDNRGIILRFGPYHVDVGAHALLKSGARVSIQEQPFQILLALLENPGQLVTREQLRLLLWGDETFVDFDQSMNSAMRRLRSALEDNPKQPQYIETVPRVGFRFRALVLVEPALAAEEAHCDNSEPPALAPENVSDRTGSYPAGRRAFFSSAARPPFALTTAALAIAALTCSVWFAAAGRSLHLPRSIAPVNVSLRTSGVPLRPDPSAHAKTLEALTPLPLTIATATASPFAGKTVNTLLRAQAISNGPVSHAEPVDLAILEGRYFLSLRNVESYERASQAFRRALALDGDSTAALVGLAQVHVLLSMEGVDAKSHTAEAISLAQRALVLDQNLASAHTALAAAQVIQDWNWAAARREFKTAIDLDPTDGLSHLWYAMFVLVPTRQYAAAEQETLCALSLDPLSLIAHTDLGLIYSDEGRRDEALAQYHMVLRMNAQFVPARFRIAQLLESEGHHRDALPFEPSDASLAHHRLHLAWLHQTKSGDPCGLANVATGPKSPHDGSLLLAGIQHHCVPLLYINQDPTFAGLQKDQHFTALARSLSLPEQ